ncbi:MAG: hypothetical protein ABIN94_21695 [Ferruginibacter sp.]
MENIEYIEGYFKSNPTEEEKKQFEQRVINERSFAEEVAFYISANGLVKEQLHGEKKQRFKEIYDNQKVIPFNRRPVNKFAKYLAAACVVGALTLLTWFLKGDKNSPQELANQYIQENWHTMSGTMSSSQDSLQAGLTLINAEKFDQALIIFETLAKNDPVNYAAKEYAGIAALRMQNYDTALAYFSQLEADTTLYNNPGKFNKALTLLKRNKAGDIATAKALLKQVSEQAGQELEGKVKATDWLKKLD